MLKTLRKITLVLMSIIMLATLLPLSAFAAEPTVTIDSSRGLSLGSQLTASLIGGSGTPSFRWERNNVEIPGANNAIYTITENDLGQLLSVKAVGVNAPPAYINIPRAKPTFGGTPTVTGLTYGELMSQAAIGSVEMRVENMLVAGRFEATNPMQMPHDGEPVIVSFIPDDESRFETVTTTAIADVNHISFNLIDGGSTGCDVLICYTVLGTMGTPSFTVTRNGQPVTLYDQGDSTKGFYLSSNDEVGQVYDITMSVTGPYRTQTINGRYTVTEAPGRDPRELIASARDSIGRNLNSTSVAYNIITDVTSGSAYAKQELERLIGSDVEVAIESASYYPPRPGDQNDPNGANGSFTYKIRLLCGTINEVLDGTYTVVITPDRYIKSSDSSLATLSWTLDGQSRTAISLNGGKNYSVQLTSDAEGKTVALEGVPTSAYATAVPTDATIIGGTATASIRVTAEDGSYSVFYVSFSTGFGYMGGFNSGFGSGSFGGIGMGGVTENVGTTTNTTTATTNTDNTTSTPSTDDTPTGGIQVGVQVGTSEYSYSSSAASAASSANGTTAASGDSNTTYVGGTVHYRTSDRSLMPYYYDASGNLINVPLCSYIGGELIFVGGSNISYSYRTMDKRSYSDTAGHWAADYIAEVSRMQLFVGTADNTFSPNIQMTYGMFVTVLGRMSGEYITDSNGYGDFVRWAERNGITDGIPALGNNEPLDRETAAVLLANFARYMGASVSGGTTSRFSDSDEISSYAQTAVAALTNAGIITGRDTGAFDPKAYLTRAETTVLITRIVPYIVKGVN